MGSKLIHLPDHTEKKYCILKKARPVAIDVTKKMSVYAQIEIDALCAATVMKVERWTIPTTTC